MASKLYGHDGHDNGIGLFLVIPCLEGLAPVGRYRFLWSGAFLLSSSLSGNKGGLQESAGHLLLRESVFVYCLDHFTPVFLALAHIGLVA